VRRWSWIGALAFAIGSLLSLACLRAGAWQLFLAARGLVGAGEGILYAVSSGLAARTRQPDRTFAWFAGSHVITSVLCFWLLPISVEHLGPAGAFGAMAAVGALALPLMRWTPDRAEAPSRATAADAVAGSEIAQPRERIGIAALLLLLSVGSLNLGLNTVFPFTERIGISIGFTLDEIGQILSLGAILSIAGPIAAGVLGPRGGRTLPLAFGSASQIAGVLVLVYASSHALWAGSYVISSMALMYFMPLLYGLVAFYDRSGRINAAAASVTAWTSAAGPLLAGLVLNAGGSYRFIGWLTALAYAAIFAFAYGPARAADQAGYPSRGADRGRRTAA
jgi:MFS family permease